MRRHLRPIVVWLAFFGLAQTLTCACLAFINPRWPYAVCSVVIWMLIVIARAAAEALRRRSVKNESPV